MAPEGAEPDRNAVRAAARRKLLEISRTKDRTPPSPGRFVRSISKEKIPPKVVADTGGERREEDGISVSGASGSASPAPRSPEVSAAKARVLEDRIVRLEKLIGTHSDQLKVTADVSAQMIAEMSKSREQSARMELLLSRMAPPLPLVAVTPAAPAEAGATGADGQDPHDDI